MESLELVPCPNRFKIKESLTEQEERLMENIFHTSQEDNVTSLSCDDRKFLNTMEIGIHKNQTGHWEMLLPFRQTEVRMPNNRNQAVNRLNGLGEYRMNVHLFGNGPSPAVATFGLRKTAADGEEKFGKAASNFVHRNFYVDDGLASLPTAKQAVDLVTAAQRMLATANLRLHKVVSNSVEVMEAFPAEDRGKDLRDLDLHRDSLPAQRSLGVYWNLEEDAFTFRVALPDKPFTRRGVLSTVNSIYDPLGLAVPVLLEGKLLLQQLVMMRKRRTMICL